MIDPSFVPHLQLFSKGNACGHTGATTGRCWQCERAVRTPHEKADKCCSPTSLTAVKTLILCKAWISQGLVWKPRGDPRLWCWESHDWWESREIIWIWWWRISPLDRASTLNPKHAEWRFGTLTTQFWKASKVGTKPCRSLSAMLTHNGWQMFGTSFKLVQKIDSSEWSSVVISPEKVVPPHPSDVPVRNWRWYRISSSSFAESSGCFHLSSSKMRIAWGLPEWTYWRKRNQS